MADKISKREFEVLTLISNELTMKEIAQSLFISHHTVVSHRKNLLLKLEAKNTAGLVRKAFEKGIFRLASSSITLQDSRESRSSQSYFY